MNPRLVITIILDNSAAMQGERFTNFKNAFENCLAKIREVNPTNLDLEIIAFDEFSPKVLKSYRDEGFKCEELQPYKMPFLGKAISMAIKDLSLLNSCLENIIYSNITEDDIQAVPEENVAKLIKILQFLNEYLRMAVMPVPR